MPLTSATPSHSGLAPLPDLTRLPKTVLPKRYELKLDVYPDTRKYSGLVNIKVNIGASNVRAIWLHAVNLDIQEAHLRFSQLNESVDPVEIIPVPSKECIGLLFNRELVEGTTAWLSIAFAGEISQKLEGFFSTPYLNSNGERCFGAATMFAAAEARTCFPCFDEPEFKAVFALEVTVDEHLTVLSNMPVMDSVVKQQSAEEGRARRRTDYFGWTKEMSTYLVCVVVGEFEFLQATAGDRTTVRIYTPWGQREQGRFALEVAKRSLEFFNDYFGQVYPLPKLDLVALSRLSVGAMENWGIITCRETSIITDHHQCNPATLQNVATLLSHEISHQWFGNLVTMRWWDEIYLNEGFATLMQFICIDNLYPEFEIFNKFCSDTVLPALGLDALQHSHPIEMPISEVSEINQMFDRITYCKGASVMFMLHEFLGADAFRSAIRNYMQRFAYSNASTEDLWSFLSSTSEQDVGAIMNSWIRELGFPIVKANCVPTESSDRIILRLEQERFSSVAGNKKTIWNIPLKGVFKKADGDGVEKFDLLFDKDAAEIELHGIDINNPGCWLKLNPRLTGFYRVQYGEQLFQKLLENLADKNLDGIDRMSLFCDQVATVLSETGSITRILKMVELFRDIETSVSVWKSVCGILHQIRTLTWPCEELADSFDQFCLEVLRPVMGRVGYFPDAGESSNTTMLRAVLFPVLASLGDATTRATAADLFKSHCEETSSIAASMREPVFRGVMATATRSTLQQMLMLFRQSELAEDRIRILHALGCAHDQNVLAEVLEFALSDDVQPQEAVSVLATAAANRHGHRMTWSFFMKNLDRFLESYLGTIFLFSKLVKSVTESFTDELCYRDVADFFSANSNKFVGGEHAVDQAEEHVKLNVLWRNKDISNLQIFLDSYFHS